MSERLASALNLADGDHVFDGGDFLEWHKQGDDRSLIWSTQRSASELLSDVGVALGALSPDLEGVLVLGTSRQILRGADIAHKVAVQSDDVRFLRIEFANGVALIWSRVSGNSRFGAGSEYSEASVIFDAGTAHSVQSAVRATATTQIGKLAASIVSHVAA